jgi:stearoyl-CoA desaturase (delta-9 desaturase)
MKKGFKKLLISFGRWFDSSVGAESAESASLKKIDWPRMIPFIGLHMACLGVVWVGWSWTAIIAAFALYIMRMFAITGFYHRYFSHRTFKTHRFTQFLFGVLGSTAVQRGPLWWAAHHRHHHRTSDTESDPHSPHAHSFFWSHVGWISSQVNFPTKMENVKDLAKFKELRFLDRFDSLIPFILASGLFISGHWLSVVFPQLGTSGPQMLVWGFFISTLALFHGTATINSLSHVFGNRRYDTTDESRNNFFLAIITLGEGWHNNHHHFPAATRQGFFWWELDVTYYVLKLMALFGLIWDLRGVPEHVRSAKTL